jgi:hypothetical protein
MVPTTDKARARRLERLRTMLEHHLEQPPAALEALMSELGEGELRPMFWEQLHAAAGRDGKEAELASAYQKVANPRRLKPLAPDVQVEVLMHAADYFQGMMGDWEGATTFLRLVLEVEPSHDEAFGRLERSFEAQDDKFRLAELYGLVAKSPPIRRQELATRAMNKIMLLPDKTPLPDAACLSLSAVVSASPALADVLEKHCLRTGRAAIACEIRERALGSEDLTQSAMLEQRRRLIELYLGETNTPERAIDHVEFLLDKNPSDARGLTGAERLLSNREVGSRAAAVLQHVRRESRRPSVKP